MLLCLHRWGAHEHPSLMSPDEASPGNGLLLFFRVDDYEVALKRARALVDRFEEEPHVNLNTQTREFSLRDPNGVYITISALAAPERRETARRRPDRRLHPTNARGRTRSYRELRAFAAEAVIDGQLFRTALATRSAGGRLPGYGCSVVWREPGGSCARLIVIENSVVVLSRAVDAHATPSIPPGYRRPVAARREAFTLASLEFAYGY